MLIWLTKVNWSTAYTLGFFPRVSHMAKEQAETSSSCLCLIQLCAGCAPFKWIKPHLHHTARGFTSSCDHMCHVKHPKPAFNSCPATRHSPFMWQGSFLVRYRYNHLTEDHQILHPETEWGSYSARCRHVFCAQWFQTTGNKEVTHASYSKSTSKHHAEIKRDCLGK